MNTITTAPQPDAETIMVGDKNVPLTPQSALMTLQSAVRQLKLTYEEHFVLEKCVEVLMKKISS